MNEHSKHKHFLVCPLNWGLGHATRCIPIIQQLLKSNQSVSIAGDGISLQLLRKEFPELNAYELPGYNIEYKYASLAINILLQIGKIFKTVKAEKNVIQKIVEDNKIDIIISDNRFGCRNKNTSSIYMTHQSNIEAGDAILSFFVNYVHKNWIRRFDECWIPDFHDDHNLAGTLSAPPQGIRSQYIGPLSRFKAADRTVKKVYDAIFILSGPEPQRSYFEQKIMTQLKNINGKFIVIRGHQAPYKKSIPSHVELVSLAQSKLLFQLIEQSEIIVCRSGYSSIMDLFNLQKPAILIPTPGQTEQEYLARILNEKGLYYAVKQKDLMLDSHLAHAKDFKGFQISKPNHLLSEAIQKWINY